MLYTRKQRTKLHFFHYYFGHGRLLALLRIAGGPLLMIMAMKLRFAPQQYDLVLLNMLFILGVYALGRPVVTMMTSWKNLRTIELKTEVKEDALYINENGYELKIPLQEFKSIKKQISYFRFNLNKWQGFSIPDSFFSSKDFDNIYNFTKKRK
ncbi:hypothetical protein [Persicobacter psychrovividus]|uniref:YcxB-like protein domain-containing protein n=1 Tax=Persicobacter psychrovividus TaxID=387638 RepID=A0ABN6LCG0_9BACT|nr:hypothetical protein PEPS_31540 [Persicobacter psychrovividus]